MSKKRKVSILISGTGSNMKSLVCDMEDPDHPAEPALVIADRPTALGLKFAQSKNIKTAVVDFEKFNDQKAFEEQIIDLIIFSQSEVICLAGFMRILSPKFVQTFRNQILNIHPSILPLFKGLNTHSRALNSGLRIHGATVHLVTDRLDAGKILGQCVVPILKNDNTKTLSARVLKLEHKLYPLVLRQFLLGRDNKILLSD